MVLYLPYGCITNETCCITLYTQQIEHCHETCSTITYSCRALSIQMGHMPYHSKSCKVFINGKQNITDLRFIMAKYVHTASWLNISMLHHSKREHYFIVAKKVSACFIVLKKTSTSARQKGQYFIMPKGTSTLSW